MSDDRPKLRSGRGTPLAGPSPRTTVMLSRAWMPMRKVRPGGRELAEQVRGLQRDPDPAPDEDGEQGDRDDRAEQAEFLADDGEDEVGVGAGEEEELLDALARG